MSASIREREPSSATLAVATLTCVGQPERVVRPRGGKVALLLAALTGFALLLRTQHLSDISFSFDECCSWKISRFPWSEMLDAVSRDAHPPFYYFILKGLGPLGDGPFVLRGFSVLLGLATSFAAYWFVRLGQLVEGHHVVAGRDQDFAALLAAALVATSAIHVEMSLQARPYTLGACLAVAAGCFLLRALHRTGAVHDWLGFTTAAVLLSLTHYYCVFTVAALYGYAGLVLVGEVWRSGWGSRTKRLLAGIGLSAWAVQLVWSLWWPAFQFQRSRSTDQLWMSQWNWGELWTTLWSLLSGGQNSMTVGEAWTWAGASIWGATVIALLACGGRAGRLAGCCAGVPVAAVAVYGLSVRNILGVKYLLFAQVFVLLGWSLLLARCPWRPLRAGVAAGVLAWSGFWCWQHAQLREHQAGFAGVRGAVAYLEQWRHPEEPVVVGSPFIHAIVHKHAAMKDGIYAMYRGDHRHDMLAGPPLRESDYRGVDERIADRGGSVWTVDAFELFGPNSRFEVSLPSGWALVRQEEFREVVGNPCIVVVREYRR